MLLEFADGSSTSAALLAGADLHRLTLMHMHQGKRKF
jgi:hypothetical protein